MPKAVQNVNGAPLHLAQPFFMLLENDSFVSDCLVLPCYFPGKNGQNIGIRMMETIKHTITRPVPAFT